LATQLGLKAGLDAIFADPIILQIARDAKLARIDRLSDDPALLGMADRVEQAANPRARAVLPPTAASIR